jgi:hypothetical protein
VTAVPFSKAVRDRQLLGPMDWYPRQLEILDALGGPQRRHILEIGRQSGKDEMLAVFAVHMAALRPDLDQVLPAGTTRDILVVCPRQAQAEEFIATCARHLENSPLLGVHCRVLGDRIVFEIPRFDTDGREFTARVRIIALPANARTTRGHRACAVIFNEQAHLDEAGGPGSAEALWRALTPSTRAFGRDGRILCSSTPSGRSGKFADLVQQAQNDPAFAVYHHAATWEVVPTTPEEIEEWRSELGEIWFAQEFGAEQVTAGGQLFDLTACEFLDRPALPEEGSDWVLALDPATARDRYGYALLGRSVDDPDQLVLGPVGARQTGSPGLLSAQAETNGFLDNSQAIWEAVEPYKNRGLRIASDVAKVQATKSFFGRKGVEVETVGLRGEDYKAAFISTKTRLQDGSLLIHEDPDLLEDLRLVQVRDAGTIHLPRVRGRHCDSASALVLACWLLRDDGLVPAGVSSYGFVDQFRYSNSEFG